MAEINEIVSKQAIDDIIKLNAAFGSMNTNLTAVMNSAKQFNDQLNKTASSTATAEEKNKAYEKTIEKTIENQETLTKQQIELQKSQEKLSSLRTDEAQQLANVRKQIQQENELLKLNAVLNDKTAGTLEKATAYNRLLEIEKRKLNLTTKEGVTRLKEINSQQDKNNELIAASSNKLQQQKINVGNYKSALSGLTTQFLNGEASLKQFASGVAQVGKQLLITFVTNPILLAIGAIVGAIAGLVAIFKSTDSGANALAGTFRGLKNVIDIIVDRLDALIKLDFKKAFGGLGQQIKDVSKAGYDYVQTLDDIEDREAASSNRRAKLKLEIADLINKSKDVRMSYADQVKFAEEALKKQEELNGIELGFIKERNEATLKDLATKINSSNMTIEQKQEQLKVWLQTDDLELNSLAEKDKAFAEFVNKNEKDFQLLQKSKSEETDKERELLEENRRLRTKMFSDLKAMDVEAANNAKKRQETTIKAMDETASLTTKADELNKKRLESEKELDDLFKEEENSYQELNKTAEESANILIAQAEREYNKKVLLIRATSKTKEEADERIFQLEKETSLNTIAQLERSLEATALTEEEKLKIKVELEKAKQDLDTLTTEKEIENAEKVAEKKKEINKAIQESAIQVAGAVFDFTASMYDNELAALEEKNKKGELSEKEYAKQRAEIELKQAKLKKVSASFDIIVDTASAIMSALKAGPPMGPILAVAAGITGGLQLASVLSAPLPTIPAFAKGTESTPSEFIAGERGAELGIMKTGQSLLIDKPTYFKGNQFAGMKIISNPELQSMTQRGDFNYNSDNTAVISKLDSLEKTIANKPVFIFDEVTKDKVGYRQNNHTVYNVADRYISRLKRI